MTGRLYRSVNDRVIAGVCGGVADRLDLDPALVRIAWVILAIGTGIFPFIVIYVVMAAVVPEEPGWTGVRPVGLAGSGGTAEPGGPAGPAPWDAGWASPTLPGMPARPDAVPGWVPPGGADPGWVPPGQPGPGFTPAPGWDPNDRRAARRAAREARRAARGNDPTFAILAGIFLVGLGAFLLLRNAFDIDWNLIWPAIIVTVGVLVVIAALRPRRNG